MPRSKRSRKSIDNLEFRLLGYSPKNSLTKFRKWHVEALLNQAADLLERCVRDRARVRELKAQWRLLEIERDSGILLDQYVDKYESDKMLNLQIDSLTEELAHLNKLTKSYTSVATHYRAWNKPMKSNNTQLQQAYAITAAARIESTLHQVSIQLKNRQLAWETKQREFRKTSTSDGKTARLERRKSMDAGEPLSYNEHYKVLEESYIRDFQDAYQRLKVASKGLNEFFAYSKNQEKEKAVLPENDPSKDGYLPIDANLLWVRNAITWMVGFSQLDQAWTAVFSVRTLVGEENWGKARSTKKGPISLPFHLRPEFFDSHNFVRIRGISAFVKIDGDVPSVWHGTIQLPRLANSKQRWGRTTKLVDIDQKELPLCHLGRVEDRRSPRPPEVTGATSIMNACPIGVPNPTGEWRVRLGPALDIGSRGLSSLEDIEIELALMGRPS